MTHVLSLVNTISSTSIPVEIAAAVDKYTNTNITIGSLMQKPDAKLDPDIKSMDLSLVFFSGSSNFDTKLYQRIRTNIQSNDYDIIHTHHNFSGSIIRFLASRSDIPVVSTEHNDLRHFTTAQRAINAATYRFANAHIYNSHSTKGSRGLIEKLFSNRDEVIYNGVDFERIAKGKEYHLPIDLPDGTIVTNVGVMTKQKNQRRILEAAREIEYQDTDIHIILAGSGPLEDELRAMSDRMGLENVNFTGYLPEREHIYALLHQSDVFLTPSVYEGFCVAAVEAMACSLPVIASDIKVFREVVGDNGVFVPTNDPSAIADSIMQLTSNPKSIKLQGESLHNRSKNNFNLKQTAKKHHKLYRDVKSKYG